MTPDFVSALKVGVERVAAWSDVLDAINVFPVADGDTGRNLKMSLSPLRHVTEPPKAVVKQLLLSARGNSGNIAAQFLTGLLEATSFDSIPSAVLQGKTYAWKAVHDPVPGTMLTVFDGLVGFLEQHTHFAEPDTVADLVEHLADATRSTTQLLPKLQEAGVVDAGALGMFLFFEGYFGRLVGESVPSMPISDRFKNRLTISTAIEVRPEPVFCVDTVIQLGPNTAAELERLSDKFESIVVIPHQDYYKVHFHTDNVDTAKEQLATLGTIVRWEKDDVTQQMGQFIQDKPQQAIHIMTDAAGSVTREDAQRLGLTLLDSYIHAGDTVLPESLFTPRRLYRSMRAGVRVSTSQASVTERHAHYQRVLELYSKVLYLCVGSVFTGNHEVVLQWKREHDPDDRLVVLDTTAASGRLGLIALATARFAAETDSANAVVDFAHQVITRCQEFIFLDRLKYLAAGGRLSKKNAFLGDMLHVKPIVSPTADGARKVASVRNQRDQVKFAIDELRRRFDKDSAPSIMLEYSDNRGWVQQTVLPKVADLLPSAHILLQPFSLTSGAHMGPGTWAVAFIPERV